MEHSNRFFKTACLFEASLIVIAVLLGWIVDIDPFATLYFSEPAIAIGIIGTLPLLLLFLSLEYLSQKSVVDIRNLLLKTLAPSLHQRHWTDLLLLATIAGVSEELLFRGVIQPWITASWGIVAGLWVSNIIFGLVHAVTPLYALLVTFVGLYLSLSMEVGGGENNLLIPIIIHSLYDFLAFIALMRMYRASLPTQE
ncbi:MAG: CPBP family intramembrane metalloprotease [Methylococcaceae bacterium]|nr:CPBP family intramembrane metalloprotease [Methylococcaceae bacterium]